MDELTLGTAGKAGCTVMTRPSMYSLLLKGKRDRHTQVHTHRHTQMHTQAQTQTDIQQTHRCTQAHKHRHKHKDTQSHHMLHQSS